MELINKITQPRIGDIGIGENGSKYIYNGKEWKSVVTAYLEISDQESVRQQERKYLYDKGIKTYESSSGITMTIRPDGTEYIDKKDMPA